MMATNSVPHFIEEVQQYECLCRKFAIDYKNKCTKDNFWTAIGERFGISLENDDKKFKKYKDSIRQISEKGENSAIWFG